MKLIHSYLALGDSYTIGESVPAEQSFPNQLAGLLRVRNEPILLPQIIAKTGWTTDELIDAIEKTEQGSPIPTDHDLVTLLIGVNNQYRGRDVTSSPISSATYCNARSAMQKTTPDRFVYCPYPTGGSPLSLQTATAYRSPKRSMRIMNVKSRSAQNPMCPTYILQI